MFKKCEFCGTRKQVSVYKSGVFGHICICDKCIREYNGPKQAVNDYEIGNVILVHTDK